MKCTQKRERCVFIREGRCGILEDTHFNRPCPFYKERLNEPLVDRIIDGEVFRSIRGYNGKYYVSESARVMNWVGREIKQSLVAGRPHVNLVDEYKQNRKESVAKLVADAFIPGSGRIIYKDGNYENCDRWNLFRVGEEDGE